jgi:hypothetical protein
MERDEFIEKAQNLYRGTASEKISLVILILALLGGAYVFYQTRNWYYLIPFAVIVIVVIIIFAKSDDRVFRNAGRLTKIFSDQPMEKQKELLEAVVEVKEDYILVPQLIRMAKFKEMEKRERFDWYLAIKKAKNIKNCETDVAMGFNEIWTPFKGSLKSIGVDLSNIWDLTLHEFPEHHILSEYIQKARLEGVFVSFQDDDFTMGGSIDGIFDKIDYDVKKKQAEKLYEMYANGLDTVKEIRENDRQNILVAVKNTFNYTQADKEMAMNALNGWHQQVKMCNVRFFSPSEDFKQLSLSSLLGIWCYNHEGNQQRDIYAYAIIEDKLSPSSLEDTSILNLEIREK